MGKLKQESQLKVHLLKQNSPKAFPAGAAPQMMTSLSLKRGAPDQARTKHRPLGYKARDWGAMLRHFETFTGSFAPAYEQVNTLLDMLCGAPLLNTTLGGIARREYYILETELNDLIHYAIEHGKVDAARRMLYSLLTTLSLTIKRGNQPSIESQVTLMFNKPMQDEDGGELFPMTGSVEQDEVKNLIAENVTGDGVFTLPATDLGAGGELTILPTDDAADVELKILAIAGYNDAGVVVTGDGFVAGAGINEVQRIVIGGGNGTFTLGYAGQTTGALSRNITPEALQAALEGLSNIAPGDVIVTGVAGEYYDVEFTGALAGTNVAQIVITPNGMGGNVTTSVPGQPTYNGSLTVTFGGGLGSTRIGDWTTVSSNWSEVTVTGGADGVIHRPDPFPMLPQDFSVRRAATLAELADATPMGKVHETALNITNVVEPDQVFAEDELGYQNHVGGEISIMHRLVLVDDEEDDDSEVRDLINKSEQHPATAEWFSVKGRHPDGIHSFEYQGKFALDEPHTPSAGGQVYQYEFPMELELNDELLTPDGERAIMRFITEVAA